MTAVRSRGERGEAIAAEFLRAEGFAILARNFRSRFGEIDLIAERDALLLFVEVKARAGRDFGRGVDAVTPAKQRRIVKTAQWYLARHPRPRPLIRFDVLDIDLSAAGGTPTWYQSAFEVLE